MHICDCFAGQHVDGGQVFTHWFNARIHFDSVQPLTQFNHWLKQATNLMHKINGKTSLFQSKTTINRSHFLSFRSASFIPICAINYLLIKFLWTFYCRLFDYFQLVRQLQCYLFECFVSIFRNSFILNSFNNFVMMNVPFSQRTYDANNANWNKLCVLIIMGLIADKQREGERACVLFCMKIKKRK